MLQCIFRDRIVVFKFINGYVKTSGSANIGKKNRQRLSNYLIISDRHDSAIRYNLYGHVNSTETWVIE